LQRTALARALLCAPRAIVVDEPVSRVDLVDRTALLDLLRDVAASGIAVLVVTRDVAAATLVADRLAILLHGRVVEVGAKNTIAAAPLHPYARALLSAAPSLSPRRLERTVLNGLPPPSWRLPPGCPLHPRCPDATPRCARVLPLLKLGALDRPVACHVAHGEGADDETAAADG
jgi:peptide/nickel transport system ATP-binding protein